MNRHLTARLLAGVLAALLALPATATEENAEKGEPVLARVNGEVLHLPDLAHYLKDLHEGAAADAEQRSFDVDRLVFRMVNDTLLAQEARAMGLDEEPPIPDQLRLRRERLAVEALERESVVEKVRVEDAEVRRLFEVQEQRVTLQVVTTDTRAAAEAVLAELGRGADMEQIARERSIDPYAQRGGRVQDAKRVDLQREIAALVETLDEGGFGGPVRTDLGWSVLRLVELRPADPEGFAAVEKTLRQTVRLQKARELRSRLAAEARERHPVEVHDDVFGALRAERLPDGRLVPRLPEPAAAVVTVGKGQAVTAEELRQALLARWAGVRNEEAALAAAPIVLQRLVEKKLFLAEALLRGYGDRPEIVRAVRTFETGLLVPRYLQEVVAADVEVTDEEMESYYAEHRDLFRKPPRLHLGQITVADKGEAERIARQLRDGTDLAWLAQRHSIDRFKDAGGDRGVLILGTGDLDLALAEAEPGTVLDPRGTPGHWVVLKVVARQEQGHYTFQEVSGNLKAAVQQRKVGEAIEAFMKVLRERAEIEINEEVVASLRVTGEHSAEGGRSGH